MKNSMNVLNLIMHFIFMDRRQHFSWCMLFNHWVFCCTCLFRLVAW